MKQLFRVVFVIYSVYFFSMAFMNYANILQMKFESNSLQVEIEKPEDLTNTEYIYLLKEICKKAKADILYKTYNVNDGTEQKTCYYITDLFGTYIDEKLSSQMEYDGYLSNEKGKNTLQTLDLLGATYVYPIDEIVEYNLKISKFFIKDTAYDEFEKKCLECNINISRVNQKITLTNYLGLEKLGFPTIILIFSIFLYGVSSRKLVYYKIINGYSNFKIILDFISDGSKLVFIPMICVVVVSFIGFSFYNFKLLIGFAKFLMCRYLLVLAAVYGMWFIESLIIIKTTQLSIMKGKDERKLLKYLMLFLELIVLILVSIEVKQSINQVIVSYNIYERYKASAIDLKDYVVFPINTSNVDINDKNQIEYNEKFTKFYQDTVEQYDGILIDTRNYKSVRGEVNLAESSGQISITVNSNYLLKAKIYDTSSQVVGDNNLTKGKLNILLPESMTTKEFFEKHNTYYVTEDSSEFTFYRMNSVFPTYSRFSGEHGEIKDPIVYVYNSEYMENLMLNYISGEYYMVKCTADNPYEVFKPYLEKYDLENVVPDTPYIINTFTAELAGIRMGLIEYIGTVIIYILGFVTVLIYVFWDYTIIHCKSIAIHYISGYSRIQIYKNLLFIHAFFSWILYVFSIKNDIESSIIISCIIVMWVLLMMLIKRVRIMEIYNLWEL